MTLWSEAPSTGPVKGQSRPIPNGKSRKLDYIRISAIARALPIKIRL